MAVMQQAQEESRRNMEMLAKTLSEARQDPARREEAAELAQSLKKQRKIIPSFLPGWGKLKLYRRSKAFTKSCVRNMRRRSRRAMLCRGGWNNYRKRGRRGWTL